MTPIIAGRFEQEAQAEGAAAALRHGGFDAADVTVFFVNPAGQHATYPIGGDRDPSPGAKHAHSGALKGAAIGTAVGVGVGLAASPLMGPAAVVAGAGAGTYAGSLVGALGKMEEKPAPAKPDEHVVAPAATVAAPMDADTASVRSSGIFVAVRAVEFAKRVAAVNVLGANGAQDIERADGTWQAGQWIDFDPLKPPLLVDLPAPEDVQLRK
ncbi:MAG TPA: hypothetical protein VN989_06250 [Casimicrobiaceae bacterium]|nr:hypothetical protein [Casimicrobiaceae bacterium]